MVGSVCSVQPSTPSCLLRGCGTERETELFRFPLHRVLVSGSGVSKSELREVVLEVVSRSPHDRMWVLAVTRDYRLP